MRQFLREEVGIVQGSQNKKVQISIIGTRRNPAEFLTEALKAEHPYNPGDGVKDDVLVALFRNLTLGPSGIQSFRQEFILTIIKLGDSLKAAEDQIHANILRHLRMILADKKLLLFKRMLQDSGF